MEAEASKLQGIISSLCINLTMGRILLGYDAIFPGSLGFELPVSVDT